MNALALALAVMLAADPVGPRGDAPLAPPPEDVKVKPAAIMDGMHCFTSKEVVDIGAGIAGMKAERDALRARMPLWLVVTLVASGVVVAGAVGVAVGHELKGVPR